MAKKLRSLLLAAASRFGGLSSTACAQRQEEWFTVAGVVGGRIQFDKNSGRIIDCEKTVVSAAIPSKIDGAAVLAIGEGAFEDCARLASVTLPKSVAQIGPYAFCRCGSLTSVTIPEGVKEMERAVFFDCASLTGVVLPSSVAAIRDWAFFGCDSLVSVAVPNGVAQIGSYAFLNCTRLTELEVAPGNRAYCSENGVLFSKDRTALRTYPGGKIGAYEIPSGVVNIEENAFYGCWGLTGVTVPKSVARIERYAFLGDAALTDIYYAGTRAQWNAIELSRDNDSLQNAAIHYEGGGTVPLDP